MLTQPHRNALLELLRVIAGKAPAGRSAAFLEHPFNASMTGAGHAKVSRVN